MFQNGTLHVLFCGVRPLKFSCVSCYNTRDLSQVGGSCTGSGKWRIILWIQFIFWSTKTALRNYYSAKGIFLKNGINFLCFVHPASLYNLLNKANLVHNLFLVYLSISTCFRRQCAHHQEKQLCLCDNWYLLFCVDDCLVCRVHPAYQTVIHRLNILRINYAPRWLYLQDGTSVLHFEGPCLDKRTKWLSHYVSVVVASKLTEKHNMFWRWV